MSLWERIARDPSPLPLTVREAKKNAAPARGRALSDGMHVARAYLGAPCTASVTTARVKDGASISRKV